MAYGHLLSSLLQPIFSTHSLKPTSQTNLSYPTNTGGRSESFETYLSLLMYTIERADRMCAQRRKGANGEFVIVLDLEGFTLSSGLPLVVLQEVFSQTVHYPLRLTSLYLVNSNTEFNGVWGPIKGLLPKYLDKQTFFLYPPKSNAYRQLKAHLGGPEYVEKSYGGLVTEGPGDLQVTYLNHTIISTPTPNHPYKNIYPYYVYYICCRPIN